MQMDLKQSKIENKSSVLCIDYGHIIHLTVAICRNMIHYIDSQMKFAHSKTKTMPLMWTILMLEKQYYLERTKTKGRRIRTMSLNGETEMNRKYERRERLTRGQNKKKFQRRSERIIQYTMDTQYIWVNASSIQNILHMLAVLCMPIEENFSIVLALSLWCRRHIDV